MHRVLACTLLLGVPGLIQEHQHALTPGEKLGTVHFVTSCASSAQPQFDRAVALLHSFEFASAINACNLTLKADPACGIALWGIALSHWGNPFAAGIKPDTQLRQGREALERAKTIRVGTDRERAYLEAVSKLYGDFEHVDQRARLQRYRDAMAALAARYREDDEATIFYALSIAQSAEPTDKTYASQLKAGAMLEQLFAAHPDHPGLAHYIIHSYDVPPLASRALDAARRYAKIAPTAPHALHMPSHTFTRVGSWQESIDTNILAAAAARRDHATGEELHTTDYQMYAYLQTAQDAAAKQLLDALPEIASRFDQDAIGSAAPASAGVFALAAIPARWALERRAWAEAASLQPRATRFPYAEAMTYYARAIGAAHTGDTSTAQSAIDALQQIGDQLLRAHEDYWAEQVTIQRYGAHAWLTLAKGLKPAALSEMRMAADREDRTEKAAVTPGPIAPARELLGEMLLQANMPAQALKEFETTLAREPNRFRALYGAAQAADLSGDRAVASKYYGQLLKLCPLGDRPGRPELVAAAKRINISP